MRSRRKHTIFVIPRLGLGIHEFARTIRCGLGELVDGKAKPCHHGELCAPLAGRQLQGPRGVELGMVDRRTGASGAVLGAAGTSPSIPSRRSMRCWVLGWVENRLSAPRPCSGLMM